MSTAGPAFSSEKPLRLWPGVAGAIIVVLARFVIAPFVPGGGLIGILAGAAGAALILLWWLFFSRAPWLERIGAVLLIALAAVMTRLLVHPSIGGGTTGGMLTFLLPATVPPFLVAGAILSRRSSRGVRWATMAAAVLLGSGVWGLARTDGIKGEANPQLAWRWTPTAEERLLTGPGTKRYRHHQRRQRRPNQRIHRRHETRLPAPGSPGFPPAIPGRRTPVSLRLPHPPWRQSFGADSVAGSATPCSTACASTATGTRRSPCRSGAEGSGRDGRRSPSPES